MPDEPAAIDQVGQFWDGLVLGTDRSGADLEPELATIIRRLHGFAAEPRPGARARIWEEVLANAEPRQRRQERPMPHAISADALQLPAAILPQARVGAQRRTRWALAQFATAAVSLLTLVASFFAFGLGRISQLSDQPVFIPSISATPARPDAAAMPVAAFLWQADGGPDFPVGEPSHLTIDANGNIWLPDGLEHRFLIFSPDGRLLETWGTPGSGDGQFKFDKSGVPAGAVAFDAAGNIYVADSGNARIQKFGPDRSFITAWGSEGSELGQFQFPVDVVVDDQGRVLVSDYGTATIQVFDTEGRWLDTWGGWGNDPGELSGPTGIALDASGNLWVAEHGGGRVQRFSPDGESQLIWGATGDGDQQFSSPTDVAVDALDRVFVSDRSNRVQVFAPGGELLGFWGESGIGPGEFQGPFGLALDGQGKAFVAEDSGRRLQAFQLLSPFAPTSAVEPPLAELVWQTEGGPNLPLGLPGYLALDPEGNLWVTDSANDRFQIVSPDGEFLEAWGRPGSSDGALSFERDLYPGGSIAFAPDGSFYVVDTGNLRVQKFGPDRSFVTAWGEEGTGPGQFRWPSSVAIDAQGRVYVTDDERHDVQAFDADGKHLQTIGGRGFGDGQFFFASGSAVFVDPAGTIWVSDGSNHRVQSFSPDGAFLHLIAGDTADGQLGQPAQLAIDSEGRMFVALPERQQMSILTADRTYLGAIGTEDAAIWARTEVEPGTLRLPVGLVLDGHGNIYVSDAGAERVLKFRLQPPIAPA